jgi:hypothetical protein
VERRFRRHRLGSVTGCPGEPASVCDQLVTHVVGREGRNSWGHRARDTPTGAWPCHPSGVTLKRCTSCADPRQVATDRRRSSPHAPPAPRGRVRPDRWARGVSVCDSCSHHDPSTRRHEQPSPPGRGVSRSVRSWPGTRSRWRLRMPRGPGLRERRRGMGVRQSTADPAPWTAGHLRARHERIVSSSTAA